MNCWKDGRFCGWRWCEIPLSKGPNLIRRHSYTAGLVHLNWGKLYRQKRKTKQYCKRGNIRGALIFADFAENSSRANSKTRENICDILYAHLDM